MRCRSTAIATLILATLGGCGDPGSPPPPDPVIREMRVVLHYDTHVGNYDNGYPRSPMSETSSFVLRVDSATSKATVSGYFSRCTPDKVKYEVSGSTLTVNLEGRDYSSFLTLQGAQLPDGSFRGSAHCQERAGPHSDSDDGSFVLEPSSLPEHSLVFVASGFVVKVRDTVRVSPTVVPRGGESNLSVEYSFDPKALTFAPPDRFVALTAGSTIVRLSLGGEEKATTTITATLPDYDVFPDTVVILPGHSVQMNLQSFSTTYGLTKFAVSKWSSSDDAVATVDASGVIQAVAPGTAVISAERDGFVRTGTVIVTAAVTIHFKAIAQNVDRTCALDDSGQAWCWGLVEPIAGPVSKCELVESGSGMRRRQVKHCARFPVKVSELRFKSLADGTGPTGLTDDGIMYRFDATGPTPVVLGSRFSSAWTWNAISCGVLTDASGVCWGNATNGALGNGFAPNVDPETGPPLSGNLSWADITMGCGLTTNGNAYCWGANERGRLGVGSDSTVAAGCTQACVTVPTKVLSTATYSSVAGSFSYCAVTTQGGTQCWGSISPNSSIPIASGGKPADVSSPSFSRVFSLRPCGLDLGGRVHCLVKNDNAATYAEQFSFTQLMIPFRVRAMATGAYEATPCVISDEDGAVYCWGGNRFGQLGNDSYVASVPITAPVKVAGQP